MIRLIGQSWRAIPMPVKRLGLVLLTVQGLLVAVHLTAHLTGGTAAGRRLFDFNSEDGVQTIWSSAILVAAGFAALEAARLGERRRSYVWALVGLGFLGLGMEEVVGIHEQIQVSNGVDWPVVYLPVLALGIWAIARAASEMETPLRRLLLIGLGLLTLAIGAELLSSPSIKIDFQLRNLVEENLELGGAGIVLIAALAHGRPAPLSGPGSGAAPASVTAPLRATS